MVRTRLVVLAAAGALLVTFAVVLGVDEPSDEAELSGVAAVTLEGRGYGHGRGMSQHGAHGAAQQYGKKYGEIIRFYYPGTTWDERRGWVKVLITKAPRPVVIVRNRGYLQAVSVRTGTRWRLRDPDATRWRLRAEKGGEVTRIAVRKDGRWQKVRDVPGTVDIFAGGRPMALATSEGWRRYRGRLRLARPLGARDVVNVITVEAYLRGVVPREVPALWHPHAVRAQAVAARTYAFYERAHPRGGHFHVYDTVASQVYGGVEDEHAASDHAIRKTRKRIRLDDGAPAFTQFSASNGGWTVQGSQPYQQARQDRWDPWPGNPHRSWRQRIDAADLERSYPRIGDFQRLLVRDSWRDGHGRWGGRVQQIRIIGNDGAVTVAGTDFRFRFGLKSTWFTVA